MPLVSNRRYIIQKLKKSICKFFTPFIIINIVRDKDVVKQKEIKLFTKYPLDFKQHTAIGFGLIAVYWRKKSMLTIKNM